MPRIKLGNKCVEDSKPTYFIADISANHDGDLDRAKMLIHLAAQAGADAAKFQNFRAPEIVSEYGFSKMKDQLSHQANWNKSVYQVYKDASLPWEWTSKLKAECDLAGIDYFSTPYDLEAVDFLDPYIPFFKIGSGDITWPEIIEKIAKKGKPVILATGASNICDVQRAVKILKNHNSQIVLMQCNTNYTGNSDNFKYINLNVLKIYKMMYPEIVLGLSDHTSGHATVLGAVALGARVIEKHFTDDINREGPDHPFSMTPETWRDMIERTRELESALGSTDKDIEYNEMETVILQRRCLRISRDLKSGTVITRDLINVLRPAPKEAIFPYELNKVIGMRLRNDLKKDVHLRWDMLDKQ